MILVTGPTGNVGSEVVKQLLAKGEKVRAWVRSADKGEALRKQGAEVALGDFLDPGTYQAALAGVDKVFLLSPMTEKLGSLESSFIREAKAAGVKHLVLLSTAGADMEPGITLGRMHREGEKALQASGLSWTILRPNAFMSNLFMFQGSIKAQGKLFSSSGAGRFAFIDPRDIAAVAVAALTQPGHQGQAYYLTGPEALDYAAACRKLAAATGRAVEYVDIPDAAVKDGMLKMGLPDWMASAFLEFFGPVARSNNASYLSDDVEKVLGRKPRSLDAWCQEFGPAFR